MFKRVGDDLWTDRTFPVFVAEVGKSLDRLVMLGRVRSDSRDARFRVPSDIEFVELPHYLSLVDRDALGGGLAASVSAFWSSLDDVDGAWIFGPHPLGMIFALITVARRRRLVLGVRQEFPAYARRRHPGRRLIHLAADLMEASWRGLARLSSAVVVGPELARQYVGSRRLHELHVSMMSAEQIAAPEVEASRNYQGALTILSVGRLEEEKNPLMLADILARLREDGRDWRLLVCGEGPMEGTLKERLRVLGVSESAQLCGYVPIDNGLRQIYLESDIFLHVSWTEGVPQVLFEAFAARLPIVATDVGGVAAAAQEAALLIPPGDPDAAVGALRRIAADAGLRSVLVAAGADLACRHTMEAEAAAVAAFLAT